LKQNKFNINISLISDSKYLFFFSVVERSFFFLFFLILARKVSQNDYGQIVVILTSANMYAFFFNLGFSIFIQKEVASKKEDIFHYYKYFLNITFILFLLFFPSGLIFFSNFYTDFSLFNSSIILISSYLFQLAYLPISFLNGKKNYKIQFKVISINRAIGLILLIILFFFAENENSYFLMIIMITTFCYVFYLLLYIQNRYSKIKTDAKPNINYFLITLKFIVPIYFTSLLNYFYDKTDLLLISNILGYSEAGYYSIAYGIVKSSTIFFSFLLTSFYSDISGVVNNDSELKKIIEKNIKLLLPIVLLLSLILFSFSDLIINIFYGIRYENSIPVFRVLSFSLIFIGINYLVGNIINAIGSYKINFVNMLLVLILNILLNIIFIKYYGIIASAFAYIISELFLFFLGIFYLIRYFKKLNKGNE